jgi:hypothetical protein
LAVRAASFRKLGIAALLLLLALAIRFVGWKEVGISARVADLRGDKGYQGILQMLGI